MLKKTRTILFWICVALFLVAAPAMVLYSQGYRFDFDTKKITQTGGLFLKIAPKQTEVYLDGKLKEKTDFFFGSLLIENLLPKKYKIEVKKDGFFPWEKTLEIKEKGVQECKNVVLFPAEMNWETLSKEIKQFWFSPDGKKIILKEKDQYGWALKLYDSDKKVKSHLIAEQNISRKGAELLNLNFTENPKEIKLELGITEQIRYFSLNLDKSPPLLTELKNNATSSEKIIVSKKISNDVYSLDSLGYLFKNQEKLNKNPFPVKLETEYDLEVFFDFVFLRENKTLYQLNNTTKSFEKFFEDITALELSPDFKKLLYFSNHEIWILFLREELGQPQRQTGQNLLLLRLSEEIKDCFWLNSNYLVFNTKNQIKISETDDRDRLNTAEIKTPAVNQSEDLEIFWNKADKKLYILKGETFYSSAVLLSD